MFRNPGFFLAFYGFFMNLLSGQYLHVAVEVSGKLLHWFSRALNSVVGMDFNSGGCDINAVWDIDWCGSSNLF